MKSKFQGVVLGVQIRCYSCCPFPGEIDGIVKCSLTELWEKTDKCKSGNDVNNLVNSLS